MNEEIGNKAVELSDEEIEKAAGGCTDYPDGFVECKALSESCGAWFCAHGCDYHGSQSCMSSHHSPNISDASILTAYDRFINEHR